VIIASFDARPQPQKNQPALKEISIFGQKACGVDSDSKIFCIANIDQKPPAWSLLTGELSRIDVFGDLIAGVNSDGEIWWSYFNTNNFTRVPDGHLGTISLSQTKACGTNVRQTSVIPN
jgi:hypothetical protein